MGPLKVNGGGEIRPPAGYKTDKLQQIKVSCKAHFN